jgi:hypothetical protein
MVYRRRPPSPAISAGTESEGFFREFRGSGRDRAAATLADREDVGTGGCRPRPTESDALRHFPAPALRRNGWHGSCFLHRQHPCSVFPSQIMTQPTSEESPLMQPDPNAAPATTASVTDDAVVARLFDLARQGDTATREFQLLDFVIQKRLLQTYGGEVSRSYAA